MFNRKSRLREVRRAAISAAALALIADSLRHSRRRYLIASVAPGDGVASIMEDLPAELVRLGHPVVLQHIGDGAAVDESELVLVSSDGLAIDATLIQQLAGIQAVILVARAGATRRQSLVAAVEMLRGFDLPIAGSILADRPQVVPRLLEGLL